jgi:hypothetical protein
MELKVSLILIRENGLRQANCCLVLTVHDLQIDVPGKAKTS